MTFTVAIAGRPNVGKSTLFNRLAGKSMALVSDEPGVTRDWRESDGHLFDLTFRVLDTAGLEDVRAKGSLAARAAAQTKLALEQTDVIVLLVDARAGLMPEDKVIARELRRTGKPILLLANKCEGTWLPEKIDEIIALGFGDPIAISASHGDGMSDVYDALKPHVPETAAKFTMTEPPGKRASKLVKEKWDARPRDDEETPEEDPEEEKQIHVAIVGRPNAGKSTLVNKLIGEERMLTGPEPGLTRDSIPVGWSYKGTPVRLVDTAGLRRRARISENLEKMSTHESLRAIRLAHVVVLVVDAAQPLDKQDLTIAHHVVEEGRALVIAINKWDAVKDKRAAINKVSDKLQTSLHEAAGLPVVTISALKGDGLNELMKAVMKIYEVWNTRVSTGKLNRWLEDMEANHPPPITSGRRIKLRYMTQVKARPPTFSLWVNKPINLPDSYQRFLTNGLREVFNLKGVPIRWQLKKSENPYEGKKKER